MCHGIIMTNYNRSSSIDTLIAYPGYGLFQPNMVQMQNLEFNNQKCSSWNGRGRENLLDFAKTKVRKARIGYSYYRMLDEFDEFGKKICSGCKQDTRYAETLVDPGQIKDTAYLDAGLEYQARSRILGTLVNGDLTTGVTLGEGPKTFRYLKDKITSLNSVLKDMKERHSRLKLLKKIPKWAPFSSLRLAGRWLEYRFAIQPLISDIGRIWNVANNSYVDGNYHMRDNDIKKFLGFTLKAHSKKTVDFGWVRPVQFEVLGYSAENTQMTTRRITYVTKGYISDPHVWALRQVGLYNYFDIAWELVPLSFFVDYFVPIGKTLAAADATEGYTFAESSVTWTVIDRVETNVKGSSGRVYKGKTGSGSALRLSRTKSRRIISPRTFSPKLSDVINGAKLNLNLSQVLDALALTRTIIFGKK